MPSASKSPSSMRTLHLPHVRFSPQTASMPTPSSRLASRIDVPSSICPRRPDGWKTTVYGDLGVNRRLPLPRSRLLHENLREIQDCESVTLVLCAVG